MKHSIVILLLATLNAVQAAEKTVNRVKSRHLAPGSKVDKRQHARGEDSAAIEAMEEMEEFRKDVEDLLEDVAQAEADLVETEMVEAHARVGNIRNNGGPKGRHVHRGPRGNLDGGDVEEDAETQGGHTGMETRQRGGDKTRAGRGGGLKRKKKGAKEEKDDKIKLSRQKKQGGQKKKGNEKKKGDEKEKGDEKKKDDEKKNKNLKGGGDGRNKGKPRGRRGGGDRKKMKPKDERQIKPASSDPSEEGEETEGRAGGRGGGGRGKRGVGRDGKARKLNEAKL